VKRPEFMSAIHSTIAGIPIILEATEPGYA
jgi:hypothetical protein